MDELRERYWELLDKLDREGDITLEEEKELEYLIELLDNDIQYLN